MPKENKKSKKNMKKYMVIGVIIALLLILAGLIGVYLMSKDKSNDASKTYPLGSGLEYIGKQDYGCIGLCDSAPGSDYYYATDMSVEEVVRYFKNTQLDQAPRTIGDVVDFSLVTNNGNAISIYYYKTREAASKKHELPIHTKKYFLSVPDFSYEAAKDSLN